jgi:hypothetical protein
MSLSFGSVYRIGCHPKGWLAFAVGKELRDKRLPAALRYFYAAVQHRYGDAGLPALGLFARHAGRGSKLRAAERKPR